MKRLLSLDILRGFTIMAMIVVNNGVGSKHFEQLTHSEWNGVTCCDLIFPFFLFMVGVSITLSLSKQIASPSWQTYSKIIKRTVKLFVLGILLCGWDMLVRGDSDILAHIRIPGVLQRIALCYACASFIVLWARGRRRTITAAAVVLLVVYAAMLHLGNGYARDASNLAAVVDKAVFTLDHLYAKSPIDPEGLLGTISGTAHTLLGVLVGMIIKRGEKMPVKLLRLTAFALVMIAAGILIHPYQPWNKAVWSPSYVCYTVGIATLLLTLLTIVVDVVGLRLWSRPFEWFGLNAIALYVGGRLIASGFRYFHLNATLPQLYARLPISPEWVSVAYGLTLVFLVGILAYALHKHKIYIRM